MTAFNRPLITGRPSTEAVSIAKKAKIETASKIEVSIRRLEDHQFGRRDRRDVGRPFYRR
jgi:hypothetical protein